MKRFVKETTALCIAFLMVAAFAACSSGGAGSQGELDALRAENADLRRENADLQYEIDALQRTLETAQAQDSAPMPQANSALLGRWGNEGGDSSVEFFSDGTGFIRALPRVGAFELHFNWDTANGRLTQEFYEYRQTYSLRQDDMGFSLDGMMLHELHYSDGTEGIYINVFSRNYYLINHEEISGSNSFPVGRWIIPGYAYPGEERGQVVFLADGTGAEIINDSEVEFNWQIDDTELTRNNISIVKELDYSIDGRTLTLYGGYTAELSKLGE